MRLEIWWYYCIFSFPSRTTTWYTMDIYNYFHIWGVPQSENWTLQINMYWQTVITPGSSRKALKCSYPLNFSIYVQVHGFRSVGRRAGSHYDSLLRFFFFFFLRYCYLSFWKTKKKKKKKQLLKIHILPIKYLMQKEKKKNMKQWRNTTWGYRKHLFYSKETRK